MQELDYNPSKKDLTDAKIHHLLAEELKPYKRVRVPQQLRQTAGALFYLLLLHFYHLKKKKNIHKTS